MDISEIIPAWSPPLPSEAPSPGKRAEEIKEAAQKFEAVLLNQFLGQALKPLLHASLGSNAPGAHIYQHMLTDAIATQLSQEETFGMSTLLQMQLTGELAADLPAAENLPNPLNFK